jgi:bifunctional DNA-binding transcriptional regulator/antitoxin component of YhaV-PrlF toxin-antitoxin module
MGSVNAEIIKERECKSMSYGFTNAKSIINNNCQITIPETMLKKLGFEKGDVLQLTATDHLIVIEKCEDKEDEY